MCGQSLFSSPHPLEETGYDLSLFLESHSVRACLPDPKSKRRPSPENAYRGTKSSHSRRIIVARGSVKTVRGKSYLVPIKINSKIWCTVIFFNVRFASLSFLYGEFGRKVNRDYRTDPISTPYIGYWLSCYR